MDFQDGQVLATANLSLFFLRPAAWWRAGGLRGFGMLYFVRRRGLSALWGARTGVVKLYFSESEGVASVMCCDGSSGGRR